MGCASVQRFFLVGLVVVFVSIHAGSVEAGGGAVAMNTAAQADTETISPVDIPQPLTREAARDLMARLSDDQVRDLLLRQLDGLASEGQQTQGVEAEARAWVHEASIFARQIGDAALAMLAAYPELVHLPAAIGARFAELPGYRSPIAAITLLALALGAGFLVERLVRRRIDTARGQRRGGDSETNGAGGQEKPQPSVVDAVVDNGVFAVATIACFMLVVRDGGPLEQAMGFVVAGVVVVRLVRAASLWLLSPHDAVRRRVGLDDEGARNAHRGLMVLVIVHTVGDYFGDWLGLLGVEDARIDAVWLVDASIFVALLFWAILKMRSHVARLIEHAGVDSPASRTRRFFARNWHTLLIVYTLALFLMSMIERLAHAENVDSPGLLSLAVVIAVPILDGLYGVRLRRWFTARAQVEPMAAVHGETAPEPVTTTASVDEAPPANETEPLQATANAPADEVNDLERALRQAVLATLVLAAVWILVHVWNLDVVELVLPVLGQRIVDAVSDVGLTILLGWFGWKVARAAIDDQLGPQEDAGPGEGEGGGKGATRLQTVLPLLRRFLVITLGVMLTLVVLSALGVNIGPLLAGAGIVGLAVGFGAQTLVRDVVSGAFFLMEDAFRKGEYIDIGSVKGTVENISVRSLRLRHHLGAIHTIPYGEITRLTNYSRDWVVIRLEFRVPYDTDVQQVKKIFKQIGAEMQAHPELGKNLLQPFKSQGVIAMEDSAMIMRAKFMAKPGEQFLLRREFYTRIQQAFADNGIHFAHRKVTVSVEQPETSAPIPQAALQAAGAAAIAAEAASEQADPNMHPSDKR